MRLYELLAPDTVPYPKIEEIKKLIRRSAMNPDFNWASALDLVHRAYHTAEVDRPMPSLKAAWAQYQENISFAVQQLQQATEKRIRDDSWRSTTTSTNFRR
jgi:hypothetical protein